ncbi:hypothetical protein AOLI_G00130660 [Acnodon oligacanthus]
MWRIHSLATLLGAHLSLTNKAAQAGTEGVNDLATVGGKARCGTCDFSPRHLTAECNAQVVLVTVGRWTQVQN